MAPSLPNQAPEWPWAARKRYMRPCLAMNGTTIYNTSYMGEGDDQRRCMNKRPDHGDLIGMGQSNDGLSCYAASYEPTEGHINCKKPDEVRPEDNLKTGIGNVAGDTINKMSFPGWTGIAPPSPFAPNPCVLGRKGSMSGVTTTRHDYTAKGATKPDLITPADNIKVSLRPLEGDTTAQLSYKEPDHRFFEPAQPFCPKREFKPPELPMENGTTARMSYLPVPLRPKEDYPWAAKKKYAAPETAMEGASVYNQSFLDVGDNARREPYKRPDHGNMISMGHDNDGLSCYGASYEPTEGHVKCKKPESIKPEDNLKTGIGDVAGDTVNKMSFPGWTGIAPPLPIAPRANVLAAKGPISCVTTSRHDYTTKKAVKPGMIVPAGEIKISNRPIEAGTTAGLSYSQPDMSRFNKAESFAPKREFERNRPPFEGESVASLSYTGEQPVGPFIIASRTRRAPAPLSEAERHAVCSPANSEPVSRKPSREWGQPRPMAALDAPPEFEICRPQEGSSGVPHIPNFKDFLRK